MSDLLKNYISWRISSDPSKASVYFIDSTKPKYDGKNGYRYDAIDLKEEIKVKNDAQIIEIQFQVDKYGKLPFATRRYKASTPVMTTEKVWFSDLEKRCLELTDLGIKFEYLMKSDEPGKCLLKRQVRNQFTIYDILDHIRRFYASEFPEQDLELLLKLGCPTYSRLGQDALLNKTVLYRQDIMESCSFFDGLDYIKTKKELNLSIPVYRICLSS